VRRLTVSRAAAKVESFALIVHISRKGDVLVRWSAGGVAEALDHGEQLHLEFVPGGPGPPVDHRFLQGGEEALDESSAWARHPLRHRVNAAHQLGGSLGLGVLVSSSPPRVTRPGVESGVGVAGEVDQAGEQAVPAVETISIPATDITLGLAKGCRPFSIACSSSSVSESIVTKMSAAGCPERHRLRLALAVVADIGVHGVQLRVGGDEPLHLLGARPDLAAVGHDVDSLHRPGLRGYRHQRAPERLGSSL
jgi:hypothetical protein